MSENDVRPAEAVELGVAPRLTFAGGRVGALAPFVTFLAGVIALGLSGAPDERGFWPVLLLALAVGIVLADDRNAYCGAVLAGMSRPIVLLMILAWLTAGVLGALLAASGLVESLVWLVEAVGLGGRGVVLAAFVVCCLVSTATGTSLGTLIVCAPLLYPAGVGLGAPPAVLLGAILGGATFGDNISPLSDTTIASATSQGAELGGVVRSRLKYALPAAALALLAYAYLARPDAAAAAADLPSPVGGPGGLWMLIGPIVVLVLLLRNSHLLTALLAGSAATLAVGLGVGQLRPAQVLYVDAERFGARGLIVDGVERGVGLMVFTLLLTGLVGGLERAGLLDDLTRRLAPGGEPSGGPSRRRVELSIFATISAAVVLTTHSVVAILAAGSLTRRLGSAVGISANRRANLLDVTVCTYPFLLPYCIPTVLAATTTAGLPGLDLPRVSPFEAGLFNAHSWALLAIVLFAVTTGWGGDE